MWKTKIRQCYSGEYIVDSYYWKCYVRSGCSIISASVRTADRRNDRYCAFSEQIDRIIRFDVRCTDLILCAGGRIYFSWKEIRIYDYCKYIYLSNLPGVIRTDLCKCTFHRRYLAEYDILRAGNRSGAWKRHSYGSIHRRYGYSAVDFE